MSCHIPLIKTYKRHLILRCCCCTKTLPLENHFNNTLITHEKVLIDNYGVIYTEDKHVLIRYPSSLPHKCYSIASECVKIGDYAFEGDEDPDPELVYPI